MIAHSFEGERWAGPAPRRHLRRRRDVPGSRARRRRHPPRHRARDGAGPRRRRRAELPQPRRRPVLGRNTSTEVLARVVADRLADRLARVAGNHTRPGHRDRRDPARVARRLGLLRALGVRRLHAVIPDSVPDQLRPSGGNTYDQRLVAGLACRMGSRRAPRPRRLAGARYGVPTSPRGHHGQGARRRADARRRPPRVQQPRGPRPARPPAPSSSSSHLPLEGPESAVLSAAAAVLTTSTWTRDRLLALYGLDVDRVHVAEPGVDRSPLAPGTAASCSASPP